MMISHDRIHDTARRSHCLFNEVNPFIPSPFDASLNIKKNLKWRASYNIKSDAIKTNSLADTQTVQKVSRPLLLKNASDENESSKRIQSTSTALVAMENQKKTSQALVHTNRRALAKVPVPQWHAPWELSAVVSGHLGWVRSIAFDPSNEWFVTGSADRTIKVWDLAKCCSGSEGGLKLTLTGHINAIRGLAISSRHPYLFSCGEDKMVKCWDLEYNKTIRQYHGHLSAVFSLALHPTLELLISGGRDSVARVWDIRTKHQIHVLGGHNGAVSSILTNTADPQVISGSHDNTVKLWDLGTGRCFSTLTQHKKAVRGMCKSNREFTFASAGADNIKKWQCRDGSFIRNMSGHNSVINCVSLNDDGVLVSGGDNGSIKFWDYETGYCFQTTKTIVQPGSLDSEAGIFASSFDLSGSRFITCEADKTIKIWKEIDDATEDTHPIDMTSWTKHCQALKRY